MENSFCFVFLIYSLFHILEEMEREWEVNEGIKEGGRKVEMKFNEGGGA